MKEQLFAAGGAASALAASTCCVIPLALVAAGVGGAWMGALTVLAPFQPVFIALALVFLGAGFWFVYGRSQQACPAGECGPAAGRRIIRNMLVVKGLLWLGAGLVALSVGGDFGASLLL